ncbi:hypothetical protein M3J09_008551 [Ascochyta lentis]
MHMPLEEANVSLSSTLVPPYSVSCSDSNQSGQVSFARLLWECCADQESEDDDLQCENSEASESRQTRRAEDKAR